MKITMKTTIAGPTVNAYAGKTIEVENKKFANDLIKKGYAEPAKHGEKATGIITDPTKPEKTSAKKPEQTSRKQPDTAMLSTGEPRKEGSDEI